MRAFFLYSLSFKNQMNLSFSDDYYLSSEQPQGDAEIMEYGESCATSYLAIQYLLLHHSEYLQYTVESKPVKQTNKRKRKSSKKGKCRPPVKIRAYHLVHIDDEKMTRLRRETENERHCPAWGVRGHYRHYKSGKTVYIKPFIKGKHPELYSGREYVLFPDNTDEMEVTENGSQPI